MASEVQDVIVIGAGPVGLCAAKTYCQVHPEAQLLLLEAFATLGGTWSKERLYKDLKSNNLVGTLEYPDYPMDIEKYGLSKGQPIPGPTVHRYFVDYAKNFGIYDKIVFRQNVIGLERDESGCWNIRAVESDNDKVHERIYHAKKIILASGATSEPNIPVVPGASDFQGSIFHVKDFAENTSDIYSNSRVAVMGGAKSAYDAIYNYASAGHEVDWIIRPSGRGPVWMTPSHVTPLKLWLEQLVSTRFLTWFIPCIWSSVDGYSWQRWFLHETWLGKMLVSGLSGVIDNDMTTLAGYDNHESTKKLKPWYSSFNVGANLSILNYPTDFFDHVRNGKVRIHIAEVDHLSEKTVHLSTGEKLPVDTLFFATGWRFAPKFLNGLEEDFGMAENQSGPDNLAKQADKAILARYPQLSANEFMRHPPSASSKRQGKPVQVPVSSPALRLHRFLVPPKHFEDRSVVVASSCFSLRTLSHAHVTALWTVAFFDGKLKQQQPGKRMTLDEIEYEAALHAQSGRWTTPGGYAGKGPDIVFQQVPYFDMLFDDMGLQRWRKIEESKTKGGWFANLKGRIREMFEPYMPADYVGIADEWLQKERKTQ